jgi:hypothetical protein
MNFTEADKSLERMLTAVKSLQGEVNRLKLDIRAARRDLQKGIITDARIASPRRPARRRLATAKTPKRARRDRSGTVATATTQTASGMDHP